jgi:two-component system sensor histidine kinase PilS (NtrC family)
MHLGLDHPAVSAHLPTVFTFAMHLYLGLAVVALLAHLKGLGSEEKQGQLAVFADILFITVMMHASGGVLSGLGMLIGVSIALGSLSQAGRTSLLFAALASLAVLTEQLYAQFDDSFVQSAYTQAGLLGVSFFALALLADRLGRRASESAELAEQREADLASLAELNDYVIQQMRAGILVVDDQGVIEMMNEAAWVLLGMPVAMRHYPIEEASPPLARQYRRWAASPETASPDFRTTAGGRDLRAHFTTIATADRHNTLVVLEDKAQLTAEAQQLKLASLGRLTAGIAHEVRNPLGAISHAAQLLDESDELAETDRRMIEIIRQNSRRVNEVVESILKLSRQDSPADPGQLRQVIDVLCDNAIAHFDRRPVAPQYPAGRRHHARVRRTVPGTARQRRRHPGERPGQPVRALLHDPPQGTGLGLYIARQLCEANHIRIEYLAPPTGGSCFRLSFPNPRRSRQL